MKQLHGPTAPGLNRSGLLAFERDPDETGRHLPNQSRSGYREFEQQDWFRPRIVLYGETDVTTAVSEEGSGDLPAERGGQGEMRRDVQPSAGGDYDIGERDYVEE